MLGSKYLREEQKQKRKRKKKKERKKKRNREKKIPTNNTTFQKALKERGIDTMLEEARADNKENDLEYMKPTTSPKVS